MPKHKSSKKRMITSKKANLRNRIAKSNIRTVTKKVLAAGDKQAAQNALKDAYSVLDKSVLSKVIHRNKAANQKARLARVVQKIGA